MYDDFEDSPPQEPMNQAQPLTPQQTQQVSMWLHLSQLANYLIPTAGIIAPIVIWSLYKDRSAVVDANGRMVINWLISLLIYLIVSGILIFVLIGFPLLLVLLALSVIYPIIGAIKAADGVTWNYPGTIKFI